MAEMVTIDEKLTGWKIEAEADFIHRSSYMLMHALQERDQGQHLKYTKQLLTNKKIGLSSQEAPSENHVLFKPTEIPEIESPSNNDLLRLNTSPGWKIKSALAPVQNHPPSDAINENGITHNSDSDPTLPVLNKTNTFVRKTLGFLSIGGFVFLSGAGLLFFLVELLHWNVYVSYAIQAIYSIELNFILNRTFIWRDREGKLVTHWLRFHAAKVVTVLCDQIAFAILVHLGLHYMAVNVMTTATLTAVNYFTNEYFVFKRKKTEADGSLNHENALPIEHFPTLGIVVPCRNSEAVIYQMVESLIHACDHYPGSCKIILVGSPNDPTWIPIRKHIERGTVHIIETPSNPKYRDSNRKRLRGGQEAILQGCEVIFFTDTRTLTPYELLEQGIKSLLEMHVDAVGGTFKRFPDQNGWWARVLDDGIITDVPRFGSGHILDPRHTTNMPITACLFMTADLFKSIENNWPGESARFPSHEDTLLAMAILNCEFSIWVSDSLFVFHEHRKTMNALTKKWYRAGIAIANIYNRSPEDVFSRNRAYKAGAVTMFSIVVCIAIYVVVLIQGSQALITVGTVLLFTGFLVGLLNVILAHDIRALLYPLGTSILVMTYDFGFIHAWLSHYYDRGELLQIR